MLFSLSLGLGNMADWLRDKSKSRISHESSSGEENIKDSVSDNTNSQVIRLENQIKMMEVS